MSNNTASPAAEATPTPAAPAGKTRKARVVLTPAQRREVVTLWKTGAVHSLAELARRFNVSREAIENTLDKAGARNQKAVVVKEAEKKTEAAMAAVMSIEPALLAKRVFDTKNETYRLLEMLRKLIGREIVEARQQNKPLGSIQNEIKTLKEAAAAIKICREEAFAVLGISTDKPEDDDDLPELKVSTLTDEQIRALQQMPAGDGLDMPEADYDLPVVAGEGEPDGDAGDHVEGEDE